jgi:hypothetical protein
MSKTLQTVKRRERRAPTGWLWSRASFTSEFGLMLVSIAINRVVGVYQANALAPESSRNGVFWPSFGPATRIIRRFTIFDRWGTNVYERSDVQPQDLSHGWDGRYKDRFAEPGVYVWLLQVELWDGTTELLRGDVTVIR